MEKYSLFIVNKMNTVISGVPVTVYKEGVIQIKNEVVVPLYDVYNYLKVCIVNREFKVHDIIASVFFEYNMAEKDRFVSHIDKNPRNNHVDNLKIQWMGSKRKIEHLN